MLVFVLLVGLIFFGCCWFLGFFGGRGGVVIGVCFWYKFWYNDFFFIIMNYRMLIGCWFFYRDYREFLGNKVILVRMWVFGVLLIYFIYVWWWENCVFLFIGCINWCWKWGYKWNIFVLIGFFLYRSCFCVLIRFFIYWFM